MYTLYGSPLSSATQRVRTILNLKRIPFNFISIDYTKGEQLTAAYQAIHPRQMVPALKTPQGDILVESLPICEYLEEMDSQYPMMPKNLEEQAKVRSICEFVNL